MSSAPGGRIIAGVALCCALAPSTAQALNITYCNSTGSDYINNIHVNPSDDNAYTSSCIPPMLQSVEATSFSIAFKVEDPDANTPLVATLYTQPASGQSADSPTQFYNIPFSAICETYWDLTSSSPACFQRVTFTGLTPGTQYYYDVNLGVNGTCNGSAGNCANNHCSSSTQTCAISGGNWFSTRRSVTTAPAPQVGSTQPLYFMVMGDSRNGDQSPCGDTSSGNWSFGNDNTPCGGSNAERYDYAYAIQTYAATNPVDQIIHGGDLAESDGLKSMMTYIADMASFWRDVSITVAFGNHEFSSPDWATQPAPATPQTGEQETFGAYYDTNAFTMLAGPVTPVSGGSPAYPAGSATYYAQNYGNVHIIYLDAQLCEIDALAWNPFNPPASPTCDNGTTAATHLNETSANQLCSCYTNTLAQRQWLVADLKAANGDSNIDWIFVSQHKAYWSNGPADSSGNASTGVTGEWTNTLAKLEYSDYGSGAFAAPGATYTQSGMKPLDALYQMYNVDLVLSSHAHFTETVVDARNRNQVDPGLPHMLIGGSGAAEQLYQCPQSGNCFVGQYNHTAGAPYSRLPANVTFESGGDEQLFVGLLNVAGPYLVRQVRAVTGTSVAANPIASEVWMTSRKSLIREGGYYATSSFNGCNVPYPPSSGGFSTDVNCTVH